MKLIKRSNTAPGTDDEVSCQTRIFISNEFYDAHRGKKDFFLAEYFANSKRYEPWLFTSNHVSLLDEAWIKSGSTEATRIASGYPGVKIAKYSAIRVIRNSGAKKTAYLIPNPIGYLWTLIRLRPEAIVDVIYTTLTPRSLLNFIYARVFNKRLIMIDPGDEGKNQRVMIGEKSAFDFCAAIITVSPASKRRIINKYSLRMPAKVAIMHKMLSDSDFKFDPRFCKAECTVGYVGRFLSSKGFDKFLKLTEILPDNIRFVAVGQNEENFILPRRIELHEPMDNDQMFSIYSEIDILVIPDLSQFKSYPTVAQEGLLCGCEVWVGKISDEYFPSPSYLHFLEGKDEEGLDWSLSFLSGLTRPQKIEMRKRVSTFYHKEMDPRNVARYIEAIIGQHEYSGKGEG